MFRGDLPTAYLHTCISVYTRFIAFLYAGNQPVRRKCKTFPAPSGASSTSKAGLPFASSRTNAFAMCLWRLRWQKHTHMSLTLAKTHDENLFCTDCTDCNFHDGIILWTNYDGFNPVLPSLRNSIRKLYRRLPKR